MTDRCSATRDNDNNSRSPCIMRHVFISAASSIPLVNNIPVVEYVKRASEAASTSPPDLAGNSCAGYDRKMRSGQEERTRL
jgi:hypothetical protein